QSHRLTPCLVVADVDEAVCFYVRAFGAEEVRRVSCPCGHGVVRAELTIGGAIFFLASVSAAMGGRDPLTLGGTSVGLQLGVVNVDAVFSQAIAAGATVKVAPTDTLQGGRFAKFTDPFGHEWSLATYVKDVSSEEPACRSQRSPGSGRMSV